MSGTPVRFVEGLMSKGIDPEQYIRSFGYASECDSMEIDPAWFSPPLPGMEDLVECVATVAEAEDMLERKKRDAMDKVMEDKGMYKDGMYLLNLEQASLMAKEIGIIVSEAE